MFTRREFGQLMATSAIATSMSPVLAATASGAAMTEGAAAPIAHLLAVHPELRAIARGMLDGPQPSVSMATLEATRRRNLGFARPVRTDVTISERLVPGSGSSPEVKVYVVNADPAARRPAIVYLHGGGFIAGAAASDLLRVQELAVAVGAMAVSVEYRLAPETRWQGSTEDVYAALKWLHANAESLGADRERIAVVGGSAGGGHAAMLANLACDRGEVPLVLQCLSYPMLDDRTGSSVRVPPHIGFMSWTPESNRFGWGSFLGHEPGRANADARAVPARRTDLRGLAPAFIGVGSIDLFVDEDMQYARRLVAAGVPTELVVVPGAFHSFDAVAPAASISAQYTAAKHAALRRAFERAVPG